MLHQYQGIGDVVRIGLNHGEHCFQSDLQFLNIVLFFDMLAFVLRNNGVGNISDNGKSKQSWKIGSFSYHTFIPDILVV